ncbi:MAG: SIR2 family protein [Terracidiphilus sp.]
MLVKIQNENTFLRACAEGLNLFAGSGFSVLAQDYSGRNLPTGSQLQTELITRFSLDSTEDLTLPQLCTIIESERRDELYSFLRERFTVKSFDPAYLSIDSLLIKSIFTTNVDDLFFKIYAESKNCYLNDMSIRGPSLTDRSAIDFIALHGSIVHTGESLVFGASDIAASFSADPDKWYLLTEKIQKRPTLFCGYSLADAGTLQALNPRTTKGRVHQDKWIALNEPTQGDIRYFGALGFQIIESDTLSLLDYIRSNAQPTEPTTPKTRSTAHIFPEYALPAPGSVPVRPILDFCLGNSPTWPDIYTARIPRTHHFARVQNLINAKQNTIVLGMPACGKTTLMMQLASQSQFEGHKIVCNYLTEARARLIIRKLESEHALIFVDDFADAIESFNVLSSNRNVTVIAFDRDLNFESVSHRIDKSTVQIVEVSELNARDIQDVFSFIPSRIRGDSYSAPRMGEGVEPSLFEVIESNITEAKLNERFRDVLRELEKDEEHIHDLLVMCCYVHSCRTPVSFDMAMAFMRSVISDYDELYICFDKLKSLVVDYGGEFADSEQDHFTPRSSLVSEAILKQVSAASFQRVLIRFHSEVSSLRICRFDIFRRRAFDAKFIEMAFRSWQEGMEFYERQYQYDRSPYLRQQGALYLAHKRRYMEAFQWIDEAVSQSEYKVPSIRNTHAIILFNANVNALESDGTKRNMLDRSMGILAECYKSDSRKVYHAVTFADQSIQYFDLYADQPAQKYLETSAKWLRDEARTNAWNRSVLRLLRQVERRLQ